MFNQQFLIILIVLYLAFETYSGYTKRNKILCRFRQRNRTLKVKWAKMDDDEVSDGDYTYNVLTERIVSEWYRKGIYLFFPILIPTLDYIYNSRWPLDLNTGQYSVISPQSLRVMNNEKRFIGFSRGVERQSGSKRQGGLMAYLPLIAVGLVIMVAIYFYQQNQGIIQHMAVIENMLKAVTK